MIRLGVCARPDCLLTASEAGFSYLEAPLSPIAALPEAEFAEMAAWADDMPLGMEVMSDMLPAGLRVTGEGVSARAQHEYLSRAFARAKRLGAQIAVLDGGAARAVPEGFDTGLAWRQLENFFRLVQGHARDAGLMVAVQPLRRAETNLLNYLSEASLMTSLFRLSNIGVAADTYQMAMVNEPLSQLRLTGGLLWHVRASNAMNRSLPRAGDGERYEALFAELARAGSDGRVSCGGAEAIISARDAQAACARMALARRQAESEASK